MPRDLFVHPTVASLVANLADDLPEVAEQGPVTGAVPLTPIQHWFFQTQADALNHLTFSMLVELAPDLDEVALEAALAALATHHDALRLRFEHLDGSWHQHNAPVEPATLLERHDLSAVDPANQRGAMDEIAASVHAGFDLGQGPLLKAVLFD